MFNYVGHAFLNNLEVRLLGMHQITNAALAVAAAEELGVEDEAIREGLKKAENPGRLQIIGRNPLVVLDGAHNVHGVKELIANLNLFNYEKLIVVFGVMADKDWKTMLNLLGLHADVIIANQPEGERAADAEKVAAEATAYAKSFAEKDVKKSFALAKKEAGKKDMILVCGSLYMLGELLTASKSRKPSGRKSRLP
jgi:dihydrofolate synthase/folylpolyglutamate synthase